MVHPQIHEHGAALRGANLNQRSRRLIKCAKDSGHCPMLGSSRFPNQQASAVAAIVSEKENIEIGQEIAKYGGYCVENAP